MRARSREYEGRDGRLRRCATVIKKFEDLQSRGGVYGARKATGEPFADIIIIFRRCFSFFSILIALGRRRKSVSDFAGETFTTRSNRAHTRTTVPVFLLNYSSE